jgi:hypothetical protein
MELNAAFISSILFAIGTILLAIGLILTGVLHVKNIRKVHKLMSILQENKSVDKSHFYKEMTVSQGINFTALAFASWIMLFVAIAFFYLLVPTVLPFSYMDVAELASNPLGFGIFGIVVGMLAAIVIFFLDKLPDDRRELRLTEIYSFYSISKGTKKMIGVTLIPLWISVFISAYIGTIYPERSILAQLISLILLLISSGILVIPVYKEAWEARR